MFSIKFPVFRAHVRLRSPMYSDFSLLQPLGSVIPLTFPRRHFGPFPEKSTEAAEAA